MSTVSACTLMYQPHQVWLFVLGQPECSRWKRNGKRCIVHFDTRNHRVNKNGNLGTLNRLTEQNSLILCKTYRSRFLQMGKFIMGGDFLVCLWMLQIPDLVMSTELDKPSHSDFLTCISLCVESYCPHVRSGAFDIHHAIKDGVLRRKW